MLLSARFLVEQLQPAVAADAVRQVNDEIALAELQEAVDRAAGGALRGARELGAMEELGGADEDQAGLACSAARLVPLPLRGRG